MVHKFEINHCEILTNNNVIVMTAPLVTLRTWSERETIIPFKVKSFDLKQFPESRVDSCADEVRDGKSQIDNSKILNQELDQIESPMILTEIKKKDESLAENNDSTWIRCVDEGDPSSNIKIVQMHLEDPKRVKSSNGTISKKNDSQKLDEYSLTVAYVGYEKKKSTSKNNDEIFETTNVIVNSSNDLDDNLSPMSNQMLTKDIFLDEKDKEHHCFSRINEAKNRELELVEMEKKVSTDTSKAKTFTDNKSNAIEIHCAPSIEKDNLVEEIQVSENHFISEELGESFSSYQSPYANKKEEEINVPTYGSGFWTDANKMQEFLPQKKKSKSKSKSKQHTRNKVNTKLEEISDSEISNVQKAKSDHKDEKCKKISLRSMLPKYFAEKSRTLPPVEKFQYLEMEKVHEKKQQHHYREIGIDIGDLEKNLPNDWKTYPNPNSKLLTFNPEIENITSNPCENEEKNSEILNNQTCVNVSTLPHPKREKPQKINTLRPVSYPATTTNNQYLNENLFDAAVVAPENLDPKDLRCQPYHQGHFVVVAVDFGTTFSGYAFSFTRDPENIHMMRKWEGGDPGVSNQKTPTCLLLTPEGEFHSFGFLARDHYHNLDPQEAKNWLYFDKFKMTLHHQMDLNRNTQLEATNGKSKPALTIFALALSYFKKHALQELSDQSATKILNEDIRWVITVPAIWRQPAKQFMRQAAYEAGLASPEYPDQLLIALEPEAASIYCRKLRMNQLVPEGIEQNRLSIFPQKPDNSHENNITPAIDDGNEAPFTGTRYMVVDCGGGTVDITVHEMTDKIGNLKELYKASGGPYGSVGVDLEFENLMRAIFGNELMDQFKMKRPAAYVDLMIAFEARKRNTSPNKTNPLNIALNFSFIDFYRKKVKGSTVENAIRKYGNKNIRWSEQGMLRLEPEAMCNLFRPIIKGIIEHIEKVLSHLESRTIQYLFLVGGFAESQILQYEIRNKFSSLLKVMIPQGVSLAILRGAVLYGLDPTVVCVRRSRLTYGVGVLNRFIRGFHPLEKMIYRDRQEWCADVFDKFVLTDQSIGIGDTILRSYTPANKSQKKITLHIYCTENDDAKFVTDSGIRRCGTLNLDLSDVGTCEGKREIQTRMIFGDTEIKISALDIATQQFVRANIDFL